MNQLLSPTVRKYIYGLCIAAIPVLIYFGLLPAESAPVLLPLVLAVLNVQETSTHIDTGHGK